MGYYENEAIEKQQMAGISVRNRVRLAKLGDTVRERIPKKYELTDDTNYYWDRETGWPCDKNGKRLFVEDYKVYVLDTSEKLAEFNSRLNSE